MSVIINVVNEGDSITEGHDCYPYVYAGVDITKVPASVLSQGPRTFVFQKSDATSTYNGINRAIAGTTVAAAVARASTITAYIPTNRFSPVPSRPPRGRPATRLRRAYILTLMFSNPTAATGQLAADATASYCLSMKAPGLFDRILLGTIMPRGDNPIANYNTVYQQPFNTIARDPAWRAASGVDGLFDIAADPIMGDPANNADLTWFSDAPAGVHPTTAGQARLAPIYGAALEAIIATL